MSYKVSIVTDIPWSLCVYVSACLLDITMCCAKTADAVWDVDSYKPKELYGGQDPRRGRSIFGGGAPLRCVLSSKFFDHLSPLVIVVE